MKIRPMREGDVNFILSTWLKSYYEALKYFASGSLYVPYPKGEVFFKEHQEKIKGHLTDKNNQAAVCIAPDDENQIIGWIVSGPDSIHYCYVKQVFRKMGVAKALRKSVVGAKYYSHHTTQAKFINKELLYNPYKF